MIDDKHAERRKAFNEKGLHSKMLALNAHMHDIDIMLQSITDHTASQNLLSWSESDLRKISHHMQAICEHVKNLDILKEATIAVEECKIALIEMERAMSAEKIYEKY